MPVIFGIILTAIRGGIALSVRNAPKTAGLIFGNRAVSSKMIFSRFASHLHRTASTFRLAGGAAMKQLMKANAWHSRLYAQAALKGAKLTWVGSSATIAFQRVGYKTLIGRLFNSKGANFVNKQMALRMIGIKLASHSTGSVSAVALLLAIEGWIYRTTVHAIDYSIGGSVDTKEELDAEYEKLLMNIHPDDLAALTAYNPALANAIIGFDGEGNNLALETIAEMIASESLFGLSERDVEQIVEEIAEEFDIEFASIAASREEADKLAGVTPDQSNFAPGQEAILQSNKARMAEMASGSVAASTTMIRREVQYGAPSGNVSADIIARAELEVKAEALALVDVALGGPNRIDDLKWVLSLSQEEADDLRRWQHR